MTPDGVQMVRKLVQTGITSVWTGWRGAPRCESARATFFVQDHKRTEIVKQARKGSCADVCKLGPTVLLQGDWIWS